MQDRKSAIEIASQAIENAKKFGADEAEAVIFDSSDISAKQRLGKTESIEKSDSNGLGLRVLKKGKKGYKTAIVSSNDFAPETIKSLAETAVQMADIAPEDEYIALADDSLFAKITDDEISALELCDKKELTSDELKDIAAEAEDTAMSVKGVTNSDSAEASFSKSVSALVTSKGFASAYESSSFSAYAAVIAGTDTNMETDYDYSSSRFLSDLKSPKEIGLEAGRRAVERLNPKKIKTCQVPIIFEKRVARSLLGHLSGAINGSAIARGTSFLKDKMGEQIFSKNINIVDDPFRKRGLASEPFDAEGVRGQKLNLVEDGVLKSWVLDIRSANKLGLKTTGHASRGTSSPPHPSSSNLYMENGDISFEDMIASIENGLFLTDAFGMGVNDVTGDYSQGASGLWIENGKISYPVSEITIAGNLTSMFKSLTPANDLEFLYGKNCPTLRIDGMTIAGN